MNENELKSLWLTSGRRLEASLNITRRNTEDIAHLKVHNFLSSMKPLKIFTILVGFLWVSTGTIVITDLFINAFAEVSKFFLFSAAIQVALTAIALIIYLFQLITIYQVDIAGPVLKTQERIASLKRSTLLVTRILFLQLPVWTTFYLNERMLVGENMLLLIVQGVVTFSFVFAALWLFFNIRYENRDKRWFQLMFKGREWTPLMKSMELLKQIEEFRTV
jgi:hypothetical protein